MSTTAPQGLCLAGRPGRQEIAFEQLSKHCWTYAAAGDPNSGVIIGNRFIMVSDATATPDKALDYTQRRGQTFFKAAQEAAAQAWT